MTDAFAADVADGADPSSTSHSTSMSRTVEPAKPAAEPTSEGANSAYVCPFCGLSEDHAAPGERAEGSPCPRCGMSDTPSTRKATKARIGPWHVRQVRNPWAP